MTAVGCVGPRTGSVGHRYVPPVLTTNISGTVISQQVGNQPQVVYAQTNFTVVSTPPVEERTWRERVLGQRPPGATSPTVIPPFPNPGVTGVTGNIAPQEVRQGNYPAPRGKAVLVRRSNGALMLAPSRQWGSTHSNFGGGTRSFLPPTVYGGSRARITASAHVMGHVDVSTPNFLKKGRRHAASIGSPLPRHGHLRGTVVKTQSFTAVVAGEVQGRSGLAVNRRQ